LYILFRLKYQKAGTIIYYSPWDSPLYFIKIFFAQTALLYQVKIILGIEVSNVIGPVKAKVKLQRSSNYLNTRLKAAQTFIK